MTPDVGKRQVIRSIIPGDYFKSPTSRLLRHAWLDCDEVDTSVVCVQVRVDAAKLEWIVTEDLVGCNAS